MAVSRANNNTETGGYPNGVCPLIKLNNVSRARSRSTWRAGANGLPRRKPPDRTNNFQPSIFIVNFTGTRVEEKRGEEETGFLHELIARRGRANFFPLLREC